MLDPIDDNAMMRLYLVHGDNYFNRLLGFRLGWFEEFGAEDVVKVYEGVQVRVEHVARMAEMIGGRDSDLLEDGSSIEGKVTNSHLHDQEIEEGLGAEWQVIFCQ